MEAAAQLFVENGIHRSTTNQIAKRAGCSVGSVYQYFPNKQSLIIALFVRESSRVREAFLSAMVEIGTDDLWALVSTFIDRTLRMFEDSAPLLRILHEEAPRVAGLKPFQALDRGSVDAVLPFMEHMPPGVTLQYPKAAARVATRAFWYTTIFVICEPLHGEDREQYIEELTSMFMSYYTGPRRPRPSRSGGDGGGDVGGPAPQQNSGT